MNCLNCLAKQLVVKHVVQRGFQTCSVLQRQDIIAWVPDKKTRDPKPLSWHFQRGTRMIKHELGLWRRELAEKFIYQDRFSSHPYFEQMEHGDFQYLWKFNDEHVIDDWITTVDRDNGDGYSYANFKLGDNKKGILSGYLDTTVPKDGVRRNAGYANIRSPLNRVSLFNFFSLSK